MANKPGILIYNEDVAIWDECLTGGQLKRLVHIIRQAADGEPIDDSSDDSTLRAAVLSVLPKISRDTAKYAAIVERRREAGRRGGVASGISRGDAKQTKQMLDSEANASLASALDEMPKNESDFEQMKQTKQMLHDEANVTQPNPTEPNPTEPNSNVTHSAEEEEVLTRVPTIEEVEAAAKVMRLNIDAVQFIRESNERRWRDADGRPVRDWRIWMMGWARLYAWRGGAGYGNDGERAGQAVAAGTVGSGELEL